MILGAFCTTRIECPIRGCSTSAKLASYQARAATFGIDRAGSRSAAGGSTHLAERQERTLPSLGSIAPFPWVGEWTGYPDTAPTRRYLRQLRTEWKQTGTPGCTTPPKAPPVSRQIDTPITCWTLQSEKAQDEKWSTKREYFK